MDEQDFGKYIIEGLVKGMDEINETFKKLAKAMADMTQSIVDYFKTEETYTMKTRQKFMRQPNQKIHKTYITSRRIHRIQHRG